MLLTRRCAVWRVAVLAALLSCTEKPRVEATRAVNTQKAGDTSSVGVAAGAAAAPTNPFAPLWDSAFGSFVGYSAGDNSIVAILASFAANSGADTTLDASPANGLKVDLFGHHGLVGSATLAGLGRPSDDEGCFEYSRGRFQVPNMMKWNVALPAGKARGLPLEDLSELHGADSATLVNQILRLAGSIHQGADSLWSDASFMIEQGTRMKLSDATVITGTLTWLRPNPEHSARNYFVVGELPATTASVDGAWRLAYVHPNLALPGDSTASGLDSEDEAGVSTAVETSVDSRPVLFLETRGNEVNGYAALGRKAPGVWVVVWNGPHEGGC